MKRTLRILFTVTCMVAAMFIAAAITMRIALHAGEVAVPNLQSLTVGEASDVALRAGLDLSIENRFYSTTVPAGRILSQAPAVGSRVRKGWQVRVTESLGPQQVTIPDVSGEPMREAAMNLRRNQLDLGILAHIDAPGDPELVLSQTPPPDAGVDQPRVSLLLSSSGVGATSAFVLPSFVGMSYSQANKAAAALGLRTSSIGQSTSTAAAPTAAPAPTAGTTQIASAAPAPSLGPSGPVLSQSPDSGFRANKGDTVRLTFAHVTIAAPPPTANALTGSAPSPSTTAAPAAKPNLGVANAPPSPTTH